MEFNYQGIFGFDVSRWQDNPETPVKNDFSKMKAYGASFCIAKAGQLDFKDRDFDYNWREIKNAGLLRASYWFGDYRLSGKAQAKTYWEILQANGYTDEMCFLDVENGSWLYWQEIFSFLNEFEKYVPARKIGIYTGYPYWTKVVPILERPRFTKYILWLAWYTVNPAYVKIPPYSWDRVTVWQDGTPPIGHEVGMESEDVDHNKLNGGKEVLEYYFGKLPVVVPATPFPSNIYIDTRTYKKEG